MEGGGVGWGVGGGSRNPFLGLSRNLNPWLQGFLETLVLTSSVLETLILIAECSRNRNPKLQSNLEPLILTAGRDLKKLHSPESLSYLDALNL